MADATIESVLQEDRLFPPSPEFVKQANVSGAAAYQALCDEASRDFEGFWGRLAKEHVLWNKPFTEVLDESNAPFFKWFRDGELNASYNCLDRHLKTQGHKTAIIFEADDGKITKITYKQLYHKVCQFANALKSLGIRKGERVIIYMPMSIEVVTAMQACARIGATHSVVFGGFSAKSLQERIIDAGAVAVITADGRIPADDDHHHEVGLRLQDHGRVLVHRGRRLGDRAQLLHLRPARGRRDRSDVRRRAGVGGRGALLENDPGPQGDGVLHRAHCDPHADQGGWRSSEEIQSEIAA